MRLSYIPVLHTIHTKKISFSNLSLQVNFENLDNCVFSFNDEPMFTSPGRLVGVEIAEVIAVRVRTAWMIHNSDYSPSLALSLLFLFLSSLLSSFFLFFSSLLSFRLNEILFAFSILLDIVQILCEST